MSSMKAYLSRSLQFIKDEAASALKFDLGWKSDLPMFRFNSVESLQNFVVGSDADIGGFSEAYWGLTPEKTGRLLIGIQLTGRGEGGVSPWKKLTVLVMQVYFGGNCRQISRKEVNCNEVDMQAYDHMFERPMTLFHRPRFDTSAFRYLAIRAKGDNRQWSVNLQTDGIYPSYLWQHRLYFEKPGEWETLLIPFRDFVLTSHGYVQPRQLAMDRTQVKTVGFSIVRQNGDFRLELDWIRAVNTHQTFGDMDIPNPDYLRKLPQAPFFVEPPATPAARGKAEVARPGNGKSRS
ncbi:hypothetical protein HDU67_003534 [Dinochytrium kinnereticum]|nr:hypothetical protein HDU67_003534 [Dinochytrium kinnereticum]